MGLFSKIFKGIKNIVKGVAKVIKKTVKGVTKIVKKVAKSKIFKAILMAAAIYYTGGAALKGFGVSGTGAFGTWATNVGTVMEGTGFLSTVTKPFTMLGTALGTGAGKVSDFVGLTTESGRLGADSLLASTTSEISGTQFTGMAPTAATQAVAEEAAAASASASASAAASAGASSKKGKRWINWGSVGTNIISSAGSGYVNSLMQEDPSGTAMGGEYEYGLGKGDIVVYGDDGNLLSFEDAYKGMYYGNADPVNQAIELYNQEIAPVAV